MAVGVAFISAVAAVCLVENARLEEVMRLDCKSNGAMRVPVKGACDVLRGKCSCARLRDDDAKALRLECLKVCAAILRFADDTISIQKGLRVGAERRRKERNRELEGY